MAGFHDEPRGLWPASVGKSGCRYATHHHNLGRRMPSMVRLGSRVVRGFAADGGVAVGWAAADEVYGNDPALRVRLQARGLAYVLAVSDDHRVPIDPDRRRRSRQR